MSEKPPGTGMGFRVGQTGSVNWSKTQTRRLGKENMGVKDFLQTPFAYLLLVWYSFAPQWWVGHEREQPEGWD